MGSFAAAEIDACLRCGGLVVTASDRAARAMASAFHRARRAEGLTAWLAPNIQDWNSFVRTAWEQRALDEGDDRLLLNPTQEQSLWASIAGIGHHAATLLEGPRHRLAALAMDAHELLCSHAPRYLRTSARTGWQHDAASFSQWLTAFDETCRDGRLLSPARLPLELISELESESTERPPLLLAGFDRILPVQRSLFDAWGPWRQAVPNPAAAQTFYHHAPDAPAELDACALWCARQLAADPDARLLVITQSAAAHDLRGQIERAFLRHTVDGELPLFEFSLGVPLSQVALPRAALLLLRWLSGPLAEHELDWLFSTGHAAAVPQESKALQAHMRALRHRNLQQPDWTLAAFVAQPQTRSLTGAWVDRMTAALHRLAESVRHPQTPLDWAELVPQLLESVRFATAAPLSSAEFQAASRWQQVVETAASLGFDGRRILWQGFLSVLARILDETLFAPESRNAPIQIAGPAESAGLTAHAVWFLGASEDAWPARGATHPLLPLQVQREAGMPHATAQLDWDLAHAVTTRLLHSASEVHFSFARLQEGVESRPSPLIAKLAGPPQTAPPELIAQPSPSPLTVPFEDFSRIPFPLDKVRGGAGVLTAQSQCPFKAFATARLAAQSWTRAEAGLTAAQRGQLLHDVLHAVWSGPPHGIRTLHELQSLRDLQPFVVSHVHRVFKTKIGPELRQRMPRRYLELEEQCLAGLVTRWLEFESTRITFEVIATEVARPVQIAGLTFDLRLDRIDRLNDNSLLVVDYKSGDVSPKSWDLPRPDDVQLPLYAAFAIEPEEELGGLVFAKVRAGHHEFAGRVGDAQATLLAGLSNSSSLVKDSFSAEQLIDWRAHIEQLARDFLAGRAEVNPREYPKTCERCGLQTLCRVQENLVQLVADEASDGADTSDSAEDSDDE
jgi:ATP-dependent helicase/nuclease subunit B